MIEIEEINIPSAEVIVQSSTSRLFYKSTALPFNNHRVLSMHIDPINGVRYQEAFNRSHYVCELYPSSERLPEPTNENFRWVKVIVNDGESYGGFYGYCGYV